MVVQKLLQLLFVCFLQIYFAQILKFNFKVSSPTDSYDSRNQIYKRNYIDDDVSVKLDLTEDELDLIKRKFDNINFKHFPAKLKCDSSIDVLPILNFRIQLEEDSITYECIKSNCVKIDQKQSDDFNAIWEVIFSILKNKSIIRNLKNSDLTFM